jgi:hypothetical protein
MANPVTAGDGLAFAILYTTTGATDRLQAPPALRAAVRSSDIHVAARLAEARASSVAA